MSIDSFIAQGHGRSTDGSWDCGCVDGNYKEEVLMGPITRAFVDTLRAHGLSVESDVDTGNDRNITYCVRDANNARARIYVSCHCDWNQAPSGTYPICHPNSPEGYSTYPDWNTRYFKKSRLGGDRHGYASGNI